MFEISSIHRIVQRVRIDPPLLSYQDSEIYRGYKFKREFRAITLHFCCEIEINRPSILFFFVFFFLSFSFHAQCAINEKRKKKKKISTIYAWGNPRELHNRVVWRESIEKVILDRWRRRKIRNSSRDILSSTLTIDTRHVNTISGWRVDHKFVFSTVSIKACKRLFELKFQDFFFVLPSSSFLFFFFWRLNRSELSIQFISWRNTGKNVILYLRINKHSRC